MNGTFIDCVKVSDSEIHDGETLTLGGGAGLQPGERSDLLASDLVFRFEFIDETRAASMGVTPSVDPVPTPVAVDSSLPPAAASQASLPIPSSIVPPSPMQEGEGKEGDDDDEDISMMLGAGSSDAEAASRKRRVSGESSDNKRRKVGENQDVALAVKTSSSSSSSSGASSAPSAIVSDAEPTKATSNPRDPPPPQNKQMSSLKDEVKCAVCYDFFFDACTLKCSHSFCQPCIEEWLHKKHECPVCRSAVESKPNRSNQLDNMVQLVMDDTERRAYEVRKRKHKGKMERQHFALESLRKRLADASAKNETFLAIKDTWSQGQKATFEQGVNQYRGTAREQYCDATGLSRDFVETSQLPELLNAAANVGLIPQGDNNEHPNLRKRMHMFISYGPGSS